MNFLEKLPKPFFVLAPMDDVTDTVFRQVIATLPYPSHVDGVQACLSGRQGNNEKRTNRTSGTESESRKQLTQQSATNTNRVNGSAGEQVSVVRRYGPDLYFTEFVNVDALQSRGREAALKRLKFTEKERPIIAQIWGKNPENFYKSAKDIVEMGFDGVDINMGCPDKAVIKNGCCIALINNRELASEIIQATKAGIREASNKSGGHRIYLKSKDREVAQSSKGDSTSLPVSVKTRLGLGEVDLTWIEFLLKQKLNMLSIHGRTAKQLSNVPANWELIGKIREIRDELFPAYRTGRPSTLIVGNGDVKDRKHGQELAKKYKLDGIMIGRGVFDDPFVFAEKSPWAGYTKRQKIDLYKKHVQLFAETWKNKERNIRTLNKFCKIYVNNFNGAKELREQLMAAKTTDELLDLLS